ncbi:hypothetical protein TRFO_37185 [Tritrichomonas foetus]|uniref:Protein kinase domain-containing protein n=1 Tax=Tritrichomonas foetus TaxID=1144522 RepID=A0A1J4JD79_9EUKA|nr:hypothetical protein TRFO_37185 [Tritrichomonas foetus]|eukprot:OHS96609.1 hypothetical protein TRFO_37185 [Tritrichomonas foetus]
MGNAVVIPSFHDWYTQPLKKLKYQITSPFDAGTFFMVFDGKDPENHEVIIKAYEYNVPLNKLEIVGMSLKYFEALKMKEAETIGIVNFTMINISDTFAFLARPKFNRSLIDFFTLQQPEIDESEKMYIFYQIYNKLKNLHNVGLFHGDLKPSNIFIENDLNINIVDPAPFKPPKIDNTRRHLFYHFFAMNSSDSGCFLAPERVIDTNDSLNLIVSDMFSLGCIATFIFSGGENLFDLEKLAAYARGEFEVSERLEKLLYRDKDIKQNQQKNNEVDFENKNENQDNNENENERKENVNERNNENENERNNENESERIKSDEFKKDKEKSEMILGLLQRDLTQRATFFEKELPKFFGKLIPFFDILQNTFYQYDRDKTFLENPQEIMQSLSKLADDHFKGGRIVIFDFLSDQVQKMTSLQNIMYTVDKIVDFSIPFPIEVKLTRVIPLILTLVIRNCKKRKDTQPLLLRQCLNSVLHVFTTIDSIPDKFSDYFDFYLKAEFHRIFERYTDEKSCLYLADFIPFFALETKRLAPMSVQAVTIEFTSIFGGSSTAVFSSFSRSIIQVSKLGGGFTILNAFFFFILSVLNNPNGEYKKEVIHIILEFYKNSTSRHNSINPQNENETIQSNQKLSSENHSHDNVAPSDNEANHFIEKENQLQNEENRSSMTMKGSTNPHTEKKNTVERRRFIEQCRESVLPICLDLINRQPQNDLVAEIFMFLVWLFEEKFVEDDFCYGLFDMMYEYLTSSDNTVRYWSKKLISFFPRDLQDCLFLKTTIEDREDCKKVFNSNIIKIQGLKSFSNEIPLVPSISKSPIHISPSFLGSFHIETSPISHVLTSHSNPDLCICVEQEKRIRWISLPKMSNPQFSQIRSHVTRSKVTSLASMDFSESFLIGHENGTVCQYDFKTTKKLQEFNFDSISPISAICSIGDDFSFLFGNNDGHLSLFDTRTSDNISSNVLHFDFANNNLNSRVYENNVNGISDICMWPDGGGPLIAVGFSVGMVNLVDLRMFSPIWSTKTVPVKRIVPLNGYSSGNPGSCAFLVIDSHSGYAEVYREPLCHSPIISINEIIRDALPFAGSAITIDDKSASLVTLNSKVGSLRLFDGRALRLRQPNIGVTNNPYSGEFSNNFLSMDASLSSARTSIHMHSGEVTCATICKNNVISCDCLGFINLWSVTSADKMGHSNE